MRNYDFTPLWRSSIGFDRLFDLINSQIPDNQDGYPPYDIVRTGEDTYRIVLAIAGFSPDDLTITAQQNLLAVSGRKAENPDHEYLHHGVSTRAFERRSTRAVYLWPPVCRWRKISLPVISATSTSPWMGSDSIPGGK